MQNVLLIAIAVSNLVVGIETSSDVEDVWLELGLLETSTSSDSNEDVQGDEAELFISKLLIFCIYDVRNIN